MYPRRTYILPNGTVAFTSPQEFADGSETAPSIHGSDSDTGPWWPAANTFAISTGGTEAARWDASQNTILAGHLSGPSSWVLQSDGNSRLQIGAGALNAFVDIRPFTDGGQSLGSDSKGWGLLRVGGNTLSGTSGTEQFVRVRGTVDQSSTAGYRAVEVDVTETATGSGDTDLLWLGVGGAEKFAVDNAGGATIGGDLDHDGSNIGFFGTAPVAKAAALTAEDASTVDTTYGQEEADVINNLRTRLGELESRLQAYGLLS